MKVSVSVLRDVDNIHATGNRAMIVHIARTTYSAMLFNELRDEVRFVIPFSPPAS